MYVGEVEEAASQCARRFRCCREGGGEGEEGRSDEEEREEVHWGESPVGGSALGAEREGESECGCD